MSANDKVPPTEAPTASTEEAKDIKMDTEVTRSEKILAAKELYSSGSRNFLVKDFAKAADELSQVCENYEELYGELSDELGMPYLFYAKSLIALALEENKVIDVADVEGDDDDDDDDDDEAGEENGEAEGAEVENKNGTATKAEEETTKVETENGESNGHNKQEDNQVDSTSDAGGSEKKTEENGKEKSQEEAQVSSTDEGGNKNDVKSTATNAEAAASTTTVDDGEKPSTSNGEAVNGAANGEDTKEEENEAASTLQLAWEILELAAKIFTRQGLNGLPNLAETHVELANIEFENNIPDGARDDYEKALKIYSELPNKYRRAQAEVYYKIGLTYLMQTMNKEAATALEDACAQLEDEINEMEAKSELTEKDKNNVADMKETQEEIRLKIKEIQETEEQNMAEVRAALNSFMQPQSSAENDAGASSSKSAAAAASSSASITSTTKPTDISHLIKRKKPDEPSSEAESSASPAKRPAA